MIAVPSQRWRILPGTFKQWHWLFNFLCCFRGKSSKQVLLQSRIFSFLHFQSFMMMTVYMQAILRLCSTYSQAVHSAAYCICRTGLAKFVILCLKEQTFLNVNNTNVFCATLFCIWMYFFFSFVLLILSIMWYVCRQSSSLISSAPFCLWLTQSPAQCLGGYFSQQPKKGYWLLLKFLQLSCWHTLPFSPPFIAKV